MLKYVILFSVISASNFLANAQSSVNFTLDFFKNAYNSNENAVMAPISIQTALSMMYHVAEQEAARIMQHRLNLPTSKNETMAHVKQLLSSLNENTKVMKLVSKMYHTSDPLNPEFLPVLRDSYGSDTEGVDFGQNENVVKLVNAWVNKSTTGMIPNFLTPSDVSKLASSMLVNVVTLNASWGFRINERYTQPGVFHFLNGDHEVDMMRVQGEFKKTFIHDLQLHMVELPYQFDTDLSMLVLLPSKDTTLEAVIKSLTAEHYQQFGKFTYEVLDDDYEFLGNTMLILPRFSMAKKLDAKPVLQKMGFKTLFERAEFKVLAEKLSFISEVKQSTLIKVNERGTQGWAATMLQSDRISGSLPIVVDRPFVFMVCKRSTKDIVFIGHYSHFDH